MPCVSAVQVSSREGGLSARGTLHLARIQAASADLHLLDFSVDQRPHDLQIRFPGAARLVIGVRNVVAVRDAFAAAETAISLNCHGSALSDQLDARHLRAVTLTVAGLEDARVTAVASRQLGTELLEELVRGSALLNMAHREPAVVERARAGLGDQLLDEWPKLFRLGLRGLDGAVLDERRREIPQERALLFARPAERPPRFAMPHWLTPPCRRAPRRRPGWVACRCPARARCRRRSLRTASRNSGFRARADQ